MDKIPQSDFLERLKRAEKALADAKSLPSEINLSAKNPFAPYCDCIEALKVVREEYTSGAGVNLNEVNKAVKRIEAIIARHRRFPFQPGDVCILGVSARILGEKSWMCIEKGSRVTVKSCEAVEIKYGRESGGGHEKVVVEYRARWTNSRVQEAEVESNQLTLITVHDREYVVKRSHQARLDRLAQERSGNDQA